MSTQIHLPDNLSIDELKEMIDYINGKEVKRYLNKKLVALALLGGSVWSEWELEKAGVLPPVAHTIMTLLTSLSWGIEKSVKTIERASSTSSSTFEREKNIQRKKYGPLIDLWDRIA